MAAILILVLIAQRNEAQSSNSYSTRPAIVRSVGNRDAGERRFFRVRNNQQRGGLIFRR